MSLKSIDTTGGCFHPPFLNWLAWTELGFKLCAVEFDYFYRK